MAKRYEKIIHIVYWTWFLFSPLVYWYLRREPVELMKLFKPLFISQFIVGATTFYFQYFLVMPKLFKSKRQIGSVVLWSIISLLIYIILRYFVEELVYPHFLGLRNYTAGTSLVYYVFDNIYFGGKYIISASLIWLVVNNAKIIEARNELQKQQAEAEINFLRGQINPHFLFNTINNIYSLVYHKSEKALPAIQKLGELMRYMTTELAKEKVELEKEIEYLRSSIDLNALRYTGGGAVNMTITGDPKRKEIAPFILLPFVENAFKYGVADEQHQPIEINLRIEEDKLTYSCRNKINDTHNADSTGTGLSNLKRRLNLLYPDNHCFNTGIDGSYYHAELEINL
ncbi:sensor histidine kinase [Flavisolibacter ginsengisoli]|uniref:Histidine kinase n=1 Tax=Flavisolibacter ginsengisoli DSM 18119 TaxID=1121884 RepID=A0A1M5BBD1_9BACT|nr:histidine kinase [Flavisolibacter ginsengisoli]SHF39819.1 Histidine kinase [Flavisolibacter ginsengisoli DSM 18119]